MSDGPAVAYRLVLIQSASQAIKAETALRRAGIASKLMPVPRTVSSQCGVCLRVSLADAERAEEVLAATGVQIAGTHDIDQDPGRKETRDEQ